jgi:hypothetical protein
MSQVPSIGRIVRYTLSESDAEAVNRRRDDWTANGYVTQPATGFQAHVGNRAEAGQVCPMLIVRVWGETPESSVNGAVILDGNDALWVTSRSVGDGPGHYAWPVVAPHTQATDERPQCEARAGVADGSGKASSHGVD